MNKSAYLGTSALGAFTASLALAGPAAAQEQDSYFVRDRNVSVAERKQPGYRPEGIRASQFILRPQLDLSVGYTTNTLGLSDSGEPALERFEDESSFYGIIRPSLTGESDWNRHEVSFDAYLEAFGNERFSGEGFLNAGVGLGGVVDLVRGTEAFGGVSYDRLNENRLVNNTFLVSEEPVRYDVARAEAGLRREVGRTRLVGRLDLADYDFDDVTIVPIPDTTRLADGTVAPVLDENGDQVFLPQGDGDQDFRDRTAYRATAEVGYAVGRDTAVFVRGSVNRQEFDGRDFSNIVDPDGRDRDSDGWKAEIGAEFDLTSLVRGEVAVGYFEQDYEDDAFDTASGIGVDAALEWFPTEMTTVSVFAERDVEQSAFVGAGSVVRSDVEVRADHELLRNAIVYAYAGYGEQDFEDFDQTLDQARAGVGGRYYFNSNVSVAADYLYTQQNRPDQEGALPFANDFDVQQVMLTLTLTP